MAIAGALHTFRGQTDAEFWSWCYRIARNKLSDHLKRRQTPSQAPAGFEDLEAVVAMTTQEEPLSTGERLDLEYAMKLLRRAKPPCCDYLWQYYILGWDYAEIAVASGSSYDGARMQVQRCLQLAQKLVQEGA